MSEHPIPQRVTVGLGPQTRRDMAYLQAEMELTKADIVNVAVNVLAYVQRQSQSGREWLTRDPQTKEAEIVRFGWQLSDGTRGGIS